MELCIWLSFVFLMSAIGSISIFLIKNKYIVKNISLFLGIAAGVMLATTLFSLLIPSFEYENSIICIIFSFGLGFLILLVLEKIPKRGADSICENEAYLAITIHNIPEGLIIGVGFGVAKITGDPLTAILLAIAIGIQNFPESMSLSFLLKEKNKSKIKVIVMSLLSAIIEPLFGFLGYFLSYYIMTVMGVILSFTAGMMLYVVLSEMLLNAIEQNKWIGTLGILIGFVLMMILEKIF